MWSGVMCRKTALAHSGAQEEYQVSVLRHSDLGLRIITVSSMDSGAGSVEVSARPALPSTSVHLRELLDDPVGDLEQLLGFGDGDARHGGGHVEDGSLLQGRHELRAEFEIDRDGGDHQSHGSGDHHPLPAQRPGRHRVVDPDQETADGVFLLGPDACPRKRRWRPGRARPAGS